MKRIKIAAIATVMIFGIGGAVIANNNMQTANVENTAPEGQPPHWVPLTDNNGCDNATTRQCIGYQAFPGAEVSPIAYGNKL